MDLFEYGHRMETVKKAPLAARMRPRTLDEVVGQSHILGPGNCSAGRSRRINSFPSLFYGPPGTGKPPWPR